MALSQRDKTKATIESLRDEVKTMNTKFKKLETDLSIIKTVKNLLMKKSVEVERQCWENAQYSRRGCLELTGIPTSVKEDVLKEKVLLLLLLLFVIYFLLT